MTDVSADFMPTNRQSFPSARIAEALSSLLTRKHPTAKHMAKAYSIDPSTAENLRKGHLSVPTLEKVVRAEGWALWAALGEELTGQSYADHLQSIIEREADVQRDRESQRDAVRRMETRARDLGRILDGSAA